MNEELVLQIQNQWQLNPRSASIKTKNYFAYTVTVHFDSYSDHGLIYRISLRLEKDDLKAEQAISVGPFEMVDAEVLGADFTTLVQERLERLVEAIEDIR